MSWSKDEWKQELSPKVLQNITNLENELENLRKLKHQQEIKSDGYVASLERERNNLLETKALNAALQNEIQELMAKKANLETKQEKYVNEIRNKENSLNQAEEILEKARQKLKTETAKSVELQRSLDVKRSEAESYAERSEKLAGDVAKLKQEKVLLVKESEGLQAKLTLLDNEKEAETAAHPKVSGNQQTTKEGNEPCAVTAKTSSSDVMLDMFKKENTSLVRELEDIKQQREQLRHLVEEKEKEVERGRSKITNMSVEMQATTITLKDREQKIQRLELSLESSRLDVLKLQKDLDKCTEDAEGKKDEELRLQKSGQVQAQEPQMLMKEDEEQRLQKSGQVQAQEPQLLIKEDEEQRLQKSGQVQTQEPQLAMKEDDEQEKKDEATLEELMTLLIQGLRSNHEMRHNDPEIKTCVVQNLNQVIVVTQDNERSQRNADVTQSTQTMLVVTQDNERRHEKNADVTQSTQTMCLTEVCSDVILSSYHYDYLLLSQYASPFSAMNFLPWSSLLANAYFHLQFDEHSETKPDDEQEISQFCDDDEKAGLEKENDYDIRNEAMDSSTSSLPERFSPMQETLDAVQKEHEIIIQTAQECGSIVTIIREALTRPELSVSALLSRLSSQLEAIGRGSERCNLHLDSLNKEILADMRTGESEKEGASPRVSSSDKDSASVDSRRDLSWDTFESDQAFQLFKSNMDAVIKEIGGQIGGQDLNKNERKKTKGKNRKTSGTRQGQEQLKSENSLTTRGEKCFETERVLEILGKIVDESNARWFEKTEALFHQFEFTLQNSVNKQIKQTLGRHVQKLDKHQLIEEKRQLDLETESGNAFQGLEFLKRKIDDVQEFVQHLLATVEDAETEKVKAYSHIDLLSNHMQSLESDYEVRCKELENNVKSASDREIFLQQKCSSLLQEKDESDNEMRINTKQLQQKELELIKAMQKIKKKQSECEQTEKNLKNENKALRKQNCSIWRDYEKASSELEEKNRELKSLMESMKTTEQSLMSLFNTIGNIDDFLQRARDMNLFQ
ncbi:hypothetical protein QZH41_017999 [Actinostola sp. cb2023]|nr:hypothetical protein QZH41_017999 [Actinostola sp. cb2023]